MKGAMDSKMSNLRKKTAQKYSKKKADGQKGVSK